MADVKCPMCSKANQADAEVCEFCGARITPVTAPLDPIKPGDAPTPKKTSDLEKTLPGWLRDARKASSKPDSQQPEDLGELFSGLESLAASESDEPEEQPESQPSIPKDLLAGLTSGFDDDEEDENVPDWLKSLRADQPEEQNTAQAPAESTLDDLLASLDPQHPPASQPEASTSDDLGFGEQKFDFDDPQDDSTFTFQEIESPEWLSALTGQQNDSPTQKFNSEEHHQQAAPAIDSGDIPSWLDDLTGSDSGGSFDAQAGLPTNRPESTPTADDSDTPDWLASLAEETPTAEQSAPTLSDDDWLASLSDDTPADEQPALADDDDDDDDTPDWLASLAEETPTPEQPPLALADDTESPDWLASLAEETPATEQPAPVADEVEARDWLASLGEETPTSEQPTPALADKVEAPDWLASLAEETPATEQPAPAADDTEAPDWLASLGEETPTSEQPTPALADEVEAPDWLASLAEETPATEQPAPVADETEAPDWLASLAEETPTAEQPALVADDTVTPDWLASLSEKTPLSESETEPEEEKKPSKAFQTGALGEIQLEETPDWLASALPSQAQPEAAPEETPDGLEPEIQQITSIVDEESLDSILSMDMPDWLSGFSPDDVETESTTEKPLSSDIDIPEEDIALASLPSWVQALRPVESAVSEGDGLGGEEQIVPEAGPLAGYRAVLPTQANFFTGRKSPVRAIKLRTDEVQQSQAALLEALVQSEGTPQPARARRKVTSDRFLRWLVTVALLLAVFVPSLLGTNLLSVPQGGSRELISFIETLRGLDGQTPVLIVVDYQPALAGEMETAFAPVLNDLMIFGKPVAFVSTLPTGPLMVSRMVERMRSEPFRHTYQAGEQFIDMGYLPGDAAGIRSFASFPRETLRYSNFGISFWDLPVLSSVETLNDFSALIIVTDNPDTGRIWVEQAGQVLGDKPLLMVISAQAEPMLIPYYDSGQVRGILTGLSGGLNYESERKYSGQAHAYWDAYGFGLMTIQVLILIGGVWSLVIGIRARRKEREEAEE